jgi:hypothetical protein
MDGGLVAGAEQRVGKGSILRAWGAPMLRPYKEGACGTDLRRLTY